MDEQNSTITTNKQGSEVFVEIRNLFCYSCSQPFVNSIEFQNHYPSCTKSFFSNNDQNMESLMLQNIEIKLETGESSFDDDDDDDDADFDVELQNNFHTSSLSTSSRFISHEPQQQKSEPTRTLSCLENSDQIQVHCWICSTGFVSLKTFLSHLHKRQPHVIVSKRTEFSKPTATVKNNNNNVILSDLPPPQDDHDHDLEQSQGDNINHELTASLLFEPFENSDGEFLGEMEDDPLTMSDLESLEIPPTTTNSSNNNNNTNATNCPQCSKTFRDSQHLKRHIQLRHPTPNKVPKLNENSDENLEGDCHAEEKDFNSQKPTPHNDHKKRFKCPVQSCSKSFSRRSILTVHSRTHTGEKPYACIEPNCGRQFTQQSGLALHVLSHQKQRPFPCTVAGCNKSFCRLKDLTRHTVVHMPEKPFKCLFTLADTGGPCGRTFRDESELKSHENVHTAKIKFTCPHSKCGQSFLERRILRLHLRKNHPTTSSQLPIVESSLNSNGENLSNDSNEAGTSNSNNFQNSSTSTPAKPKINSKPRPQSKQTEKKFVCPHPECGKAFHREKDMRRHATIHLKEKPFKCTFILAESGDICGRTFRVSSELKSHENVHTGEVSFDCTHCSKSFAEQYKLRRHIKCYHPFASSSSTSARTVVMVGENSSSNESTTNPPPPPQSGPVRLFKCTQENCDRSYLNASALGHHMKRHTGVKDAVCDVCGKAFITVATLTAHVQAVHEGLRPHLCPHCGRSFFNSGVFARHVRLHTGETPYECSQCEEKFRQKHELDRHTAIHSGEDMRKFKCEVVNCDQAFFARAALKRHILTHTGEKPFQCPLCPVAFPDPRPLKNHMGLNHPDFVEEKPE